jgi:hypothetical protein
VISLAVLVLSTLLAAIAFAGEITVVPDEDSGAAPKLEQPATHPAPETDRQPPQETPPPVPTPTDNEVDREVDPIAVQRDALLTILAPNLKEEERLMGERVHKLDRAAAYQWMAGFLSSQPLNCPVHSRDSWIKAIIGAVERNNLPICKEILGLAASIISIESGFRRDPLAIDPSRGETMAALVARSEKDLHQKLGALLCVPPVPHYYKLYREKYYQKLVSCRTERDVEVLAKSAVEDLKRDAAVLPDLLKRILYNELDKVANVVRTKGSMQLNFLRAQQIMKERGEQFTDTELCDYMYTLEGGVDVGVAALKPMFVQYAARYGEPGSLSWLFLVGMDYHYGPFSSRNMMEQIRIRDLSGRKIEIDGDLLRYDEHGKPETQASDTLKAALAALPSTEQTAVFNDFLLEKHPHYIYTNTHKIIAAEHLKRFGETPFAAIGNLKMGEEAVIKHGVAWKTRSYLKKLDRTLNSLPWDQ